MEGQGDEVRWHSIAEWQILEFGTYIFWFWTLDLFWSLNFGVLWNLDFGCGNFPLV
jgi:hypothetical protein